MAKTTTDSRQVIKRSLLDIIANKTDYAGTADAKPANTSELDNLLDAINSELTPSFYMSESATPDLVVSVGAAEIQNPETSKKRTSSANPNFTSETITFPAAAGGNIVPSVGSSVALTMSASSFMKVLVELDTADNIVLVLGTEGASEAAATLPSFTTGNTQIGYIVAETDGGSNISNLTNEFIYQFNSAGGGSGSGGAGVLILRDRVTPSASSATAVFPIKNIEYSERNNAFVYRNGILMEDVSPAAATTETEYSWTDAGSSTDTVNLATGFEADGSDEFDLAYFKSEFNPDNLAGKTLRSASVVAGVAGSEHKCTLTQTGSGSQVDLTEITYNYDLNSGSAHGDINVYVNGQKIERRVAGDNDLIDGVLYDENANGTRVLVYEWIASVKSDIDTNAPILITRESYFVSVLSNFTSHIIPETDVTYDIGSPTNRVRDLHLGPDTIHMGTDAINEGQFRWNSGTQKLQFRHLAADAWADIGSGGGGLISREFLTGVASTTITFTTPFIVGSTGNFFYKNGLLMKKVVSSPATALEYTEDSSTQITVGVASIASDEFDMVQMDAGSLNDRESVVTGQTGTTITFTKSFVIASPNNMVYKNGVLMKRVASSPATALEYTELSTTSIDIGVAAIASDEFDFIQLS